MEQDPDQSRHEIGHARQLLFSPARAEVVTIRSSSSEGGSQDEGGREKTVPHQRCSEEIEGMSALKVLLRQFLFPSGID